MSRSFSPIAIRLRLHQVHAGHRFRHRMLHLDARVDLNEIQVALLVHDELDGARIGVPDRLQRLLQRAAVRLRSFGVITGDGASSISF